MNHTDIIIKITAHESHIINANALLLLVNRN